MILLLTGLSAAFFLSAQAAEPAPNAERQVRDHEMAFARTMADRDVEAFAGFVSEEGIFLGGPAPLRGREAVVSAWAPYFEGETPPFSWEPETVVVLDSGHLALSTGPVYDGQGRKTAIFTTTWREEEPGVWRVVFDRGTRACEPEPPRPDT
jgi:ketosteroid isomerase-like protein